MPEKAVMKQLRYAKDVACKILGQAGYKVEKAKNQTFCLTAARDSEWRIIAIGTDPVVRCTWFIEQIKRLEKFPLPDSRILQKEVWISRGEEYGFHQFCWKNNQWVDENLESANIFN
jgi:hypothetical protein